MKVSLLLTILIFINSIACYSQVKTDTVKQTFSLPDCVRYALQHQPQLIQAKIDEMITDRQIKIKLADWFPQINFNYNFEHYFQLPSTVIPNLTDLSSGEKEVIASGTINNSALSFSGTQNILNRDVILASRSSRDLRLVSSQNTSLTAINVVVNVSKAFYEVLLAREQLKVLEEDVLRLQKSEKDAHDKYEGGLTDKTDYKQATIQLNNSRAQSKQELEQVKVQYALLKQNMGYVADSEFHLVSDTNQMEKELLIDTSTLVSYEKRIEYQQLQTQRHLSHFNVTYNKLAFLPSVSLYGNYNIDYFNDKIPPIYNTAYPNSFIGITASFPIFQGTKRNQNVSLAKLQLRRLDWDTVTLKTQINTEYTTAMAEYKSNLTDWQLLRDNLDLAKDVYNTVNLQYNNGIKTYLDVTIAETDLRTAQLDYLNALYKVLSSILDVKKALGIININQP